VRKRLPCEKEPLYGGGKKALSRDCQWGRGEDVSRDRGRRGGIEWNGQPEGRGEEFLGEGEYSDSQ